MRFGTPYNQRTIPPHHGELSEQLRLEIAGSRNWNSWWSRRSPNLVTNDAPPARIGIDVGSKTLKFVALDGSGNVVFAEYHRHHSDVRTSLADLLHGVIWRHGNIALPMAITGSAGIALADELGLPFVQEVIAATNAVISRYPEADCVIELGGEDAKITYLGDAAEHRMNATCAGGTGDFIDGIASMLGVKTRNISSLAMGAQHVYPIASRCAVFARTDVRPLINAGASKADIAQSALDAVVRQTLGGLACGRPIRGTVVFLGGPIEHIPALVLTFRKQLGLNDRTGIKPPDAHLFTAMGAIETAIDPPIMSLSEIEERLRGTGGPSPLPAGVRPGAPVEGSRGRVQTRPGERSNARDASFPPLFESDAEREEFFARHAGDPVEHARLEDAEGPFYLGLDAGSTTVKYALVDKSGALVASDYRDVEGDVFSTARSMIKPLLAALEHDSGQRALRFISRATVTGYGEDLLKAGFGFDDGAVETVAHLRAAQHFEPDVSFVLDIGGQDVKALWVHDGKVVDAVLNEACSSGCGAFVQSTAKSLKLSNNEFSRLALDAMRPIDLGAKCTVFMTSRVRHAQKAGVSSGDIAAGIAYSVVNNVLTRIIGAGRAGTLGSRAVVQGGTFKSDAVLRAFEKVTGVNATRPACAALMGAYGAALLARDAAETGGRSGLLSSDEIASLDFERSHERCTGCGNSCSLSIIDFGNGRRFISGNRCDRAPALLFGVDAIADVAPHAPNIVRIEQDSLGFYADVRSASERGNLTIGLMSVLNTFESTPFWHTLFRELGFSIAVTPAECDRRIQDLAAETIPSESVCYPAKTAHARYAQLVHDGADVVFMPRFVRGSRCPVSCLYADALAGNVSEQRLCSPTLRAIRPREIAMRAEDRHAVLSALNALLNPEQRIPDTEFDAALEHALLEQESFEHKIADACDRARAWIASDPRRRGVVIASRPYHVDAALIHDIDRVLAKLGFAVLPALGISPSRTANPLWKPARRLANLVESLACEQQIEIVAIRSFGCGYDAVSFDEARDVANAFHRPFTELKIDDMVDTAHIRIRLRTLAFTCGLGAPAPRPVPSSEIGAPEIQTACGTVTPDLCSTAKALVESARRELGNDPALERIRVPDVCKDCLTDALPFELEHLGLRPVVIDKAAFSPVCTGDPEGGRPVGLVGNPSLVFDPDLNDHVADLIHEFGRRVAYPDPRLLEVEDVRYLDQLEAFRDAGVTDIIYLQSFGCLKGHVQSRGALRELARRFPELRITVVDYDPESSALNRENRIRLALSAP